MSENWSLDSSPGSDVVNWISTKTRNEPKKKSKAKHPIFEKCSYIASDNMWKNIFESASKGKFPTGISYRDGKMIFKLKGKTINIVVPEDELEAFNLCKGFIAVNSGLRSNDEQVFERDMLERSRTDTTFTRLSTVNKKLAQALIYSYAEFVYRKMNLLSTESCKLVAVIKLGISLQQIQDSNIQMYNNQIGHINNIRYDSVNNKWVIDNPTTKTHERKTTIISVNNKPDYGDSFEVLWGKYLNKREKGLYKAQNSRQNLYSTYSDLSSIYSSNSTPVKKTTRGRPRGKKASNNDSVSSSFNDTNFNSSLNYQHTTIPNTNWTNYNTNNQYNTISNTNWTNYNTNQPNVQSGMSRPRIILNFS